MSNAEELVRLDELLLAGDRELVPIGPEIAGYVVLEAALRVRDVGGGVAGATELAIDVAGNVVLVAPPRRADEARAATSLRKLLGALLQVATSSTPALRACAKRKDSPSGLLGLARELEGALIPLNRAASRRGVARIARETLELLDAGELDLDADEGEDAAAHEDPSPSPPPVVRAVAKKGDARPHAAHEQAPELDVPSLPPAVVASKPRAPTPLPTTAIATDTASTRPTLVDDATPQTAPTEFAAKGATPTPFAELAAELEAADRAEEEPFEVVSHLPPPVAEPSLGDDAAGALARALEAAHAFDLPETMRGADAEPGDRTDVEGTTVAPTHLGAAKPDRVKALAAAFQVSRAHDDPGLARELKKMVGVETGKPPEVVADIDAPLRVTMRPKRRPAEPTILVDAEPAADELDRLSVDVEPPPPRGRSVLRGATSLALVALAAAAAFFGVRVALATVHGAAAPGSPPETVTTQATVVAAPTTTGRLPATCEATLVLEGVADGSEVARKLGTAPLATTLPVRVPFDLVALAEGRTPQRAHLDASTAWKGDATGPQLDVTLALDGKADARWPARVAGSTALRNEPGARGLVHVRTNPDGASVWLVVDPRSIAVPCGASVDLLVVAPSGASKPLHVEWSAFSGFPARSVARLN